MKILSCFIAGFGKFTSQNFEFSSMLTVIKEDNGWGKTTLADFIKCMLYGMENGRSKALSANDRARYEPWKGGPYGGYLVFSCDGKTYRVERSFGKTASMDTVRIYDANNMLCYDFGEKCERLGETLFGVDAESFKKSIYVPQGEIKTGNLPDDIKNRLLSLLSTGGQGENGAERAIERLDEADRSLRSRRRPLKGKLDEIDEKLEILSRKQREKTQNAEAVHALRLQAATAEKEIAECAKRIESLELALEETVRKKEREARMETARGIREELNRIGGELNELSAFFKGVDPSIVNLEGLQNAVSEFYALKEKCLKAEETLVGVSATAQARGALLLQAQTLKNTLDSYGSILSQTEQTQGAGTKRKRGKKIIPPKRKSNFWILSIALILSMVGCVVTSVQTGLGLIFLGVGVAGMAFVFLRTLPRYEKVQAEEEARPQEIDQNILREYTRLRGEWEEVHEKLRDYPQDVEQKREQLFNEKENDKLHLQGIEKGICNFLQNFAFAEIYDYRACCSILRDKIVEYKRLREEKGEREEKLSHFSAEEQSASAVISASANVELLKAEKVELENRKETLLSLRAQALSQAENLLKQTPTDLAEEEETLLREKERLELRRKAILAAKEILIRAKENMASRYLEPVERSCREYLAQFDLKENELRFTAQGAPLCEEYGKMRELEYYSTGIKELVGLCTRIALVDAIYTNQAPVLILDDPLINLDDVKTAKAKSWIKSLASKYQILYFTCKSERKL